MAADTILDTGTVLTCTLTNFGSLRTAWTVPAGSVTLYPCYTYAIDYIGGTTTATQNTVTSTNNGQLYRVRTLNIANGYAGSQVVTVTYASLGGTDQTLYSASMAQGADVTLPVNMIVNPGDVFKINAATGAATLTITKEVKRINDN